MEIVYSDKNIVVCVKPVGIDSEKDVPQELSKAFDGEFYPLHRLDLNVGGIMVYAKNKKTAAGLSKVIAEGKMKKEYLAMLHGCPPQRGVLCDLLWKDSKKNKVYVVKRERKGVKKAELEYTLLKQGDISLAHIILHTGRSHQIRVQFASRGYPLIGDHKYGSRDDAKAPMLFSHKLTFEYNGKEFSFTAYPDWMPEE